MSSNGNEDHIEPKKTLTFGKVYKTTCRLSGGTLISVQQKVDTEDEATGFTKETAAKAPNTVQSLEYVTREESLAQLRNAVDGAMAHHLGLQSCRRLYAPAPYIWSAATNSSSNSDSEEA